MITGLIKRWQNRSDKREYPSSRYLQSVVDNTLNAILLITDDVRETSITRIVREIAAYDYTELRGWTLFFDERCSHLWMVAQTIHESNDMIYRLNHLEGVLAGIHGTWILLDQYLGVYTQQRYLDRMENYNRMVAFYTAIWATLNTVYVELPANIQRIVSRAQGKKIEI